MNTAIKTDRLSISLRSHAWLLVLVWTGCIAASLLWNVREQSDKSLKMARTSAQLTFENDVLYRRWAAGQGGVYVKVSEHTQPNPYLAVPDRDVTTTAGVPLTLVNPAYMARLVHESAAAEGGTRGHITSLRPIRPDNRPDPWETAALEAFERGAPEVSAVVTDGGDERLRLMRPFVTESACLKCHAAQGYKKGDIRGGISVSVPMAPLRAIEKPALANLTLAHGVLWLFGLAGIALFKRNVGQQMVARQQVETALREHAELLDPARAEIIAREMQRVVRERQRVGAAAVEPLAAWPPRVATATGIAAGCIGLLVLTGWLFGLDTLKRVLPDLATMKVNTAICFILAGAAVVLRQRPAMRWACATVVGALAALALVEYALDVDLGVDHLLVRDPGDRQTVPGRMAQSTGLCFILASAALLLVGARARAAVWGQQIAALIVGALGLLTLLGYAYGVQQFYGPAGLANMALPAGAAFALVAIGLICSRADGIVADLVAPGVGGQLARRLLLVAVLVPALAGWVRVYGTKAGLFESNLGTGLFAITMILAFAAMVWVTSRRLDRGDAVRQETETQLRNQAELIDQAREALIVRDSAGQVLSWNRGAEELYGWTAAEALGRYGPDLLRTEGASVAEKNRQLEQHGHWEGILIHTGRDGRRLKVESRQTASRAPDGRLLVLESERDITVRQQAEERIHQSVEQLRASNAELERLSQAMVGRELRMVELKEEVNELCGQVGQPPRYPLDFQQEQA